MKKKQVLLAVFAATMLTPTVAWAQYPQISGEAKENYTKMMTEERKRSDEAWAKALANSTERSEEKDVHIFLGLVVRTICRRLIFLHSQVLKVVVCTVLVVVEVK